MFGRGVLDSNIRNISLSSQKKSRFSSSNLWDVFSLIHREHTILLNRERVNIGTKRMNSLPLCPLVISFILRDIYWENCCLQILRNTEALYSYLGLPRWAKKNFVCTKFDKGGNSLPKHFERTANIHSNLYISLLS